MKLPLTGTISRARPIGNGGDTMSRNFAPKSPHMRVRAVAIAAWRLADASGQPPLPGSR
jgi:hypothetical protein